MLNRQKVLVEMLRLAQRAVTKIEIVKWAFVLSRETSTSGGSAFYDFVPYHYGPYSFSLAREMDSLADMGIIIDSEKTWELNTAADRCTVPLSVERDLNRVVKRFNKMPVDDVIDYVYESYPAFTVNSRRKKLAQRNVGKVAVYTAGYEGLQIDGFLNLLVQNGIQCLIDVRNNPVARRFGFHKSTLDRLCRMLDIQYEHVPQLGIPSQERQALTNQNDYNTLFARYERKTLSTNEAAIERVSELVLKAPSVLVCMEADPCMCHRSRLAYSISHKTELPIVHLGNSL